MRRSNANPILVILFLFLFSAVTRAETVWIDTRSSFEHFFDNIEGDARISHGDIVEEVSKLYPDKNTEIGLYCVRGVRAGKAMEALQRAGYENVFNAGSIDEARAARGMADDE
ncbi:rhodanese-like domain-containing protein [Enterovibrio coralii]|uniref:Rhodanese domain-containing protein n=1 Tax=Enterovibrio coralii TaxID=294935 RepID=A0A135I820_9GAMM|nr:rhodanese-like domain-containing protein [Enterovibrio coralii]KXF81558.1 hypothetical protein ATN88_02415 [Enterovibrio coralii]